MACRTTRVRRQEVGRATRLPVIDETRAREGAPLARTELRE